MKSTKVRLATLAVVVATAATLLAAVRDAGSATAPDDVVFRVRPYQRYQYYAFGYDTLQWAAWNAEGSTLSGSAVNDTAQAFGTTFASLAFDADSGTFHAQFEASIDEQNRTGAFHIVTNQIEVFLYVRGPAGTPYWLLRRENGVGEASRSGGTPGSLQPVNGTASGRFLDSLAFVQTTATDVTVADTAYFLSGVTNSTAITVNGQTYTLAKRFTLSTPVQTTQAVCILGCMTSPATFHARGAGDVTLEMFLGSNPAASGPAPALPALRLSGGPSPFRTEASLTFGAPAGRPASLEVFDVRGRKLTTLFEGLGDGVEHLVTWRPGDVPAGMYFARLRSEGRERTIRLARLP